jgi:hypothetical protein
MSYLRSFNRFILSSLALLGLSVSSVNAALFEYQYLDTMSFVNISGLGLAAGQTAQITVALDNGGTSIVSQTWTASDLQSVTWDFNNGGLITTFFAPWGGGGLSVSDGAFTTDGTGDLIGVMDSWYKSGGGTDFVTSGPGIPSSWFLEGINGVYHQSNCNFTCDGGTVHLTSVGSMLNAANWTPVSTVPIPATVWLFGTALIGFVGMSRRRKVA